MCVPRNVFVLLFGEYTATATSESESVSDNAFGKLNIFCRSNFPHFLVFGFVGFAGFACAGFSFWGRTAFDKRLAIRTLLFMLIACFVRVLLRFFANFFCQLSGPFHFDLPFILRIRHVAATGRVAVPSLTHCPPAQSGKFDVGLLCDTLAFGFYFFAFRLLLFAA